MLRFQCDVIYTKDNNYNKYYILSGKHNFKTLSGSKQALERGDKTNLFELVDVKN